jgi:hypothetical protein
MQLRVGWGIPRWGEWARWAVLVWGLALIIVAGRVLLKPGQRSVYPEYERAGQNWRAGHDLYCGLGGYRYSPPATLIFAAFSLAPSGTGEALWRLLGAGLFLGGLACWGRVGLPRTWSRDQLGLLFLLAAPLSLSSLNNGQANLHLAGLLVLSVAGAAWGRWNLVTLCLVLACLLKGYPVALALLLLVLYPRQLGWRLPLGLTVGLALPLLLQDADYVFRQYHQWLGDLRSDNRADWEFIKSYRDFWLLCRLWHLPVSRQAYLALQLGAAGLTAALCLAGRLRGLDPRRLLALVLVLASCWMMLFGPATESSTYALLAVPLAWMVLDAWIECRPLWVRSGTGVSYALLTGSFLAGWFPIGTEVHALGPQPLGTLILFLLVLIGTLLDLMRPGSDNLLTPAAPSARAA